MQDVLILGVELHGDLDRCQLAAGILNDLNLLDRAHRYTLKVDRRALFQAGSVFEIAANRDFVGKHAGALCAGHQEKQGDQQNDRNKDDDADLQLRPFDFGLTRHAVPFRRPEGWQWLEQCGLARM